MLLFLLIQKNIILNQLFLNIQIVILVELILMMVMIDLQDIVVLGEELFIVITFNQI